MFRHHQTKTACVNLIFHIGINKPWYTGNDVLIFRGVFANESDPVVRAESAEGLDERERGSAALEAPRPPNSLLSISPAARPLGLRFPPTLGSRRGGGSQPNRCKELQVNVCVCVCCMFARLWILMTAHMYVLVLCVWVYPRVRDASMVLCVYVYFRGRFARLPAPAGGEFCLHIDEPATLPLCLWAVHEHHNKPRASPFQNLP